MSLTQDQAMRLTRMADELNQAQIYRSGSQAPFEVQVIDLDLSTARLSGNPFPIQFPFRSVFVRNASDVLANVSLQVSTDASYQSGVTLNKNDSLVLPYSVKNSFLTWSAQSGKTMQLIFFVSGEFRSGSQISQTGGGVAIVDGSAFTRSVTTLAATIATAILSADTSRKICSIQNNTGATLYVGDSAITSSGATRGYEVPAGATFQWRNTAALYAYSVPGGDLTLLTEF